MLFIMSLSFKPQAVLVSFISAELIITVTYDQYAACKFWRTVSYFYLSFYLKGYVHNNILLSIKVYNIFNIKVIPEMFYSYHMHILIYRSVIFLLLSVNQVLFCITWPRCNRKDGIFKYLVVFQVQVFSFLPFILCS